MLVSPGCSVDRGTPRQYSEADHTRDHPAMSRGDTGHTSGYGTTFNEDIKFKVSLFSCIFPRFNGKYLVKEHFRIHIKVGRSSTHIPGPEHYVQNITTPPPSSQCGGKLGPIHTKFNYLMKSRVNNLALKRAFP